MIRSSLDPKEYTNLFIKTSFIPSSSESTGSDESEERNENYECSISSFYLGHDSGSGETLFIPGTPIDESPSLGQFPFRSREFGVFHQGSCGAMLGNRVKGSEILFETFDSWAPERGKSEGCDETVTHSVREPSPPRRRGWTVIPPRSVVGGPDLSRAPTVDRGEGVL